MYLLVQCEIKNELGAKGFNLEARLGQMDSLNAEREGNLKDVDRTSIFMQTFLGIFIYHRISLKDQVHHLGPPGRPTYVSSKELIQDPPKQTH